MNITFSRYSPENDDTKLLTQLIECYRDVFADGPWHEWLMCPVCKKYWGIRDRNALASSRFQHCDTPLVDFWSKESVASDLRHEITSESSCWLAMNGDDIVGFCWGYPITVINLEKKLGISFSDRLKINPKNNGLIAYQDEVGVLSTYRGHKIAKMMISRRLKDFISQGLKIGIVRTRQSPDPSETFLWYTGKLGYEIIAHYPGNDGRVILARQLSGLEELLVL